MVVHWWRALPKTNINLTEWHFSPFWSTDARICMVYWCQTDRCQRVQMNFPRASYVIFEPLYEKLMLSFCSCKCNPFSYWNVISPSNRRFTFWNRLKFFNPNLINFNMIFPSWVRLGFELNSKLNVFTVKEEIHWLNTQSQAGREHLWSNDIKQLTNTVVKRGSFLAKISICFKLEKEPRQP